jgi:pimeloyl-ACP methyl ester carboxylesterase
LPQCVTFEQTTHRRGIEESVPDDSKKDEGAEGTPIEWKTPEGVRLAGEAFGDPHDQPVVLLHGGGQTRYAWGNAARALAHAGFYAVAVDLRGHGQSDWSEGGHYELRCFADDVCLIAASFDRRPAFVGASLGGLASLIAEGQASDNVMRALVLVDVAPRLEPEGVMRIISFMFEKVKEGFASLEEAAEAVAKFVPHRPKPTDLSGLEKNLRLGDDGRYRWHWDPNFLQGSKPVNARKSFDELKAAAHEIKVPTLLVRGKLSDVLSEDGAKELLEMIPHAKYVDVKAAGHMIAGDRNDVFNGAVIDFLTQLADE